MLIKQLLHDPTIDNIVLLEVYTCDQIDQSPVLSVKMRDCTIGYTTVAAIPIVALIPRAIPITYAGIPSHSNVAVIKVPKLEG